VDIKKLCGYPHNKYPKKINTRQIFIQLLKYKKTTTRSVPFAIQDVVVP